LTTNGDQLGTIEHRQIEQELYLASVIEDVSESAIHLDP
jgi:hypothetical protein